MAQDNLAVIDAYYAAMAKKDTEAMGKFLHPDIVCVGPIAVAKGKDQVLSGVKRLGKYFNKLTLRAKTAAGNQVMVVYDLECKEPIGHLPTAALLTFKDGLIHYLEIFYDGRPFETLIAELFPQAVHK